MISWVGGYARHGGAFLAWAPTLGAHDPNPPLPLLSPAVVDGVLAATFNLTSASAALVAAAAAATATFAEAAAVLTAAGCSAVVVSGRTDVESETL